MVTRREIGQGIIASAVAAALRPRIAWARRGRGAVISGGSGGSLPALQLTSSTTNTTSPWTFAQAFKQGDIPSGQYITASSGTSAFQADIRNRWPDGSVKLAVLSGISSLTANVAATVQLETTGTAPSGSNVAEPTSLPNTNVTFASGTGSYPVSGTCDINSALGVDLSTWSRTGVGRVRQILGPVMSEFHYYVPLAPASNQVAVWFYVRKYSNGAIEIETVVENGFWQLAIPAPSEADYSVTVNIAGTAVLTQSNIAHFSHTRWGRVDWYSGSAVIPAHNGTYFIASKAVPNFGWTAPAAATLTSFNQQSVNPAPFVSDQSGTAFGDLGFDLDGTGTSPWIGIVPSWDALYVTTGQGAYTAAQLAAIYAAAIGNTRQAGGFQQHFRDETTGRVPIWSNYLGKGIYQGWGTSPPTAAGGAGPGWDPTHMPACGYLAYLVEGRWSQLEECQWSAWNTIQDSDPLGNFGALQPIGAPTTTRGFAWGFRSVGQAASISPTALAGASPASADTAVRNSFVSSISSTVALAKAVYIDGTATINGGASGANGIGWIGQYDHYTGAPIPATEWWGGSWMVSFQGHAFGHVNDLAVEGLASADIGNLLCVRNFVWQDSLQMMQGSTTEYSPTWNFRRGATYERPYLGSSTIPTTPTFLAKTQAQLPLTDYQTTFGLSTSLTDNPGDTLLQHGSDTPTGTNDSSSPGGEGYWAMHASVIAMATEAGIAKAAARYALITAASNWNPQGSGASDEPQMSFAPRTVASPSWYPSSSGTWVQIPGSTLTSATVTGGPSNAMEPSFNDALSGWSSGIINRCGITMGTSFITGTFFCVSGGGHAGPKLNGIYCFGPLESSTPGWYLPRQSSTDAGAGMPINADGSPESSHNYDGLVYLPDQNWLFKPGLIFYDDNSDSSTDTWAFEFNSPTPSTVLPWKQLTSIPNGVASLTAHDPVNACVWAIQTVSPYQISKYDSTSPGSPWTQSGSGPFAFNSDNPVAALDTKRGIIAVWNGMTQSSPTFQLLFYPTSSGVSGTPWNPLTTAINAGALPATQTNAAGSIIYDDVKDCFVVWFNSGQTLYTITAPSTNPYSGGNAWTVASVAGTGATPTVECGLDTGMNGESGSTSGTFGRFNYIPNPAISGYILMNRASDPIFFYRP